MFMSLYQTRAELLPDGTLRFSLPGWRRRFELSPWRDEFVAHCINGRTRRPSELWQFTIVPRAGTDHEANPAVESFLRGIPAPMRDTVAPFAFGQFALLKALYACDAARDLAVSNPNLFWLLALGAYEGRIDTDSIGPLCRRKQADVLCELARTGRKAQVKLLRKVRINEGTLTEGRLLNDALADFGLVHAVRHLPAVPMRLLSVLLTCPQVADETLVAPIAARFAEAEALGGDKARYLARRLAHLWYRAAEVGLRDVRAALAEPLILEEEAPPLAAMREEEQVVHVDPVIPAKFPPPPLPGSEDIVPITSTSELRKEGKAQRNCAPGYAHAIASGRVYLYRVLAPERATLEIRIAGRKLWLAQLKLAGNREPSRETVKAIRAWFVREKRKVNAMLRYRESRGDRNT